MSETPMGPCGSSQCATQCAYFVHSHGTMHCRPWYDAKEPHNATRHLAPVAAVGMPPRDQPQVPPPGPTETRRVAGTGNDLRARFEQFVAIYQKFGGEWNGYVNEAAQSVVRHIKRTVTEEEVGDE